MFFYLFFCCMALFYLFLFFSTVSSNFTFFCFVQINPQPLIIPWENDGFLCDLAKLTLQRYACVFWGIIVFTVFYQNEQQFVGGTDRANKVKRTSHSENRQQLPLVYHILTSLYLPL